MATIYSNIRQLCFDNHISIHKLEQALGFGNGTIKRWEKSIPQADRLALVATYFNVPVESLMGDSMPEQKENPIRFDPDEELKNAEKRGRYSYFIDLLDMSTPEAREEALALLISRLRNQ